MSIESFCKDALTLVKHFRSTNLLGLDIDIRQIIERLEAADILAKLDVVRNDLIQRKEECIPWDSLTKNGWSIVGMNHYHLHGERHLFCSMAKKNICIKAEGTDEFNVFISLINQSKNFDVSKPADKVVNSLGSPVVPEWFSERNRTLKGKIDHITGLCISSDPIFDKRPLPKTDLEQYKGYYFISTAISQVMPMSDLYMVCDGMKWESWIHGNGLQRNI